MTRLFAPYKSILAMPGARALFLVAFVAKIPFTAKSTALTFHVVLDQHRSYGEAGVVGMAMTLGMAFGSPVLGRMIDRRGLRPVLVLTGAVELVFWLTASFLPYPVLVGAAGVAGALGLPVFGVMRQAVAAKVPAAQRRQAFALDSIFVELAFTIGPAVAIVAATTMRTARPTMMAIGILAIGSVVAIYRLDPPIGKGKAVDADAAGGASEASEASGGSEPSVPEKLPRGTFLRPSFILILATCLAANLVLTGTDIAMFATLRGLDQTEWLSVTIMVWCLASLVGGFWHGTTSRPRSLPVLMMLLGFATVPVGLVGGHGWLWLCLALLPAGFVCAPTIASASEAVSRAVPPSARGQAMGWQGSAQTVGGSLGAPLIGVVIDNGTPSWGYAVAGLIGGTIALVTLVYARARPLAAAGEGSGAPDDAIMLPEQATVPTRALEPASERAELVSPR